MTDSDRVKHLRIILSEQIAYYEEWTAKEQTGEADASYVYDTMYEQFNNLSSGDFVSIISILSEDET